MRNLNEQSEIDKFNEFLLLLEEKHPGALNLEHSELVRVFHLWKAYKAQSALIDEFQTLSGTRGMIINTKTEHIEE